MYDPRVVSDHLLGQNLNYGGGDIFADYWSWYLYNRIGWNIYISANSLLGKLVELNQHSSKFWDSKYPSTTV